MARPRQPRHQFQGTLTHNGARVPVFSPTVRDRIESDAQRINQMQGVIRTLSDEVDKLDGRLNALLSSRWVRVGAWLRLVRVP
ncbi:MAG TPA: hypothetical protein VJY35_08905 [Candidatus Eisenbacteria bacterium]|nr:hypothetical protein [Candidatus Eisenbacteria bacterium]